MRAHPVGSPSEWILSCTTVPVLQTSCKHATNTCFRFAHSTRASCLSAYSPRNPRTFWDTIRFTGSLGLLHAPMGQSSAGRPAPLTTTAHRDSEELAGRQPQVKGVRNRRCVLRPTAEGPREPDVTPGGGSRPVYQRTVKKARRAHQRSLRILPSLFQCIFSRPCGGFFGSTYAMREGASFVCGAARETPRGKRGAIFCICVESRHLT